MMETLRHLLSNPLLLTILAIVGLLVLLFFLKRLFKVALILILILLIGIFLYHVFITPGDYKAKMKGAFEKTKVKSEEVLKKGKDKIVEEGKNLTKGAKKKYEPREE